MWYEHLNLKQQVPWGTYINELDAEAALVDQGGTYVALLDCMAVIRVSGEEAGSFLQGQVTCDVNQITDTQAFLGAHCNPKGRAQATFVCGKYADDYYLVLPQDQAAPTAQALGKFAMFSKAEVSVCSDYLVMGFGGTESGTLEQTLAEQNSSVVLLQTNLIKLALIQADTAKTCVESLRQQNVPLVGDNAWQLGQINAGIPHIRANQAEQWIPQEINYDLIEGVNFKKGCYKGQEIIARIHYRGQTKVRTYPLAVTGCERLNIGDKIVSENGQGTILAVAKVSERTLKVLSTLKIEASESENLKLEQNDGCQIRVLPLPYAIT